MHLILYLYFAVAIALCHIPTTSSVYCSEDVLGFHLLLYAVLVFPPCFDLLALFFSVI
jgi:hypothetical protein